MGRPKRIMFGGVTGFPWGTRGGSERSEEVKHEDQLARDGEADSATEDAPNPAIAARETVLRKILRSEGARLVQDQDRWLIQFPSSFGSPTHVLLTPAEYEAVKDLVP